MVLPDGCEGICATIPGSVWKILVKEGDIVEKGQEIAVLESMKMEFPIASEYSGKIEKVYIKAGGQVDAGQVLAAIGTKEVDGNVFSGKADHKVDCAGVR